MLFKLTNRLRDYFVLLRFGVSCRFILRVQHEDAVVAAKDELMIDPVTRRTLAQYKESNQHKEVGSAIVENISDICCPLWAACLPKSKMCIGSASPNGIDTRSTE